MAIRVRRGNYADLDTSRLVEGEPFVTLDTLPDGDYYVGMAIAPSNVVRLATWTNLQTVLSDCQQYAEDAEDSKDAAATSETNAFDSAEDSEAWAVGERNHTPVSSGDDTYHNNSKYYAGLSHNYWDLVDAAVSMITPVVNMNFTTGELEITGTSLVFSINTTTGNLEWDISHS